jgi:hypothetical protein
MLIKALAAAAGNAEKTNWLYDFTSSTNFIPYAVAVDSQDNIIAVGRTSEDGAGGTDGVVFKISVAGEILWIKTYGDAGENQVIRAVTVDSSDNIYISGQTHTAITTMKSFWMKLDSDGQIQIEKTSSNGTNGYQMSHSIAVDASGYIYVFSDLLQSGYIYGFIELYDSSGTKQNTTRFGDQSRSAGQNRLMGLNGSVNGSGSVIPITMNASNTSYQPIFGCYTRSSTSFSEKFSPLTVANNDGVPYQSQYVTNSFAVLDSSDNIFYATTDSYGGDVGTIYKRSSTGAAVAQVGVGPSSNFGCDSLFIDASDNVLAGCSFNGYVVEFDNSLSLQNSIRIFETANGRAVLTGLSRLSNENVVGVGRNFGYTSRAFIFSLAIDGSASGTYGAWTVNNTSPSITGANNLYAAGTNASYPRGASATNTDPNYTEAAATITYSTY